MSDTAAALQQQYDQAVCEHGPDSAQAIEAERDALQFFMGKPAPVELALHERE